MRSVYNMLMLLPTELMLQLSDTTKTKLTSQHLADLMQEDKRYQETYQTFLSNLAFLLDDQIHNTQPNCHMHQNSRAGTGNTEIIHTLSTTSIQQ